MTPRAMAATGLEEKGLLVYYSIIIRPIFICFDQDLIDVMDGGDDGIPIAFRNGKCSRHFCSNVEKKDCWER
jgi:hypothetical protein